MAYHKTKKMDWRSPGFVKNATIQFINPWFYWKDADDWCEENCIKRFYTFGEALMMSWNFETEIDCILFELNWWNWKQTKREYYIILRDDNDSN